MYFLGGYDLEMVVIRELLDRQQCDYEDQSLTWGAKASAYLDEIKKAITDNRQPVLIELENDLPVQHQSQVVVIDHHGQQAGVNLPTALDQVIRRLGLPDSEIQSNRWWQLVSANDRGHLRALRLLTPPATDEEMRQVRQADLAAHGVTDEQVEIAKSEIDKTSKRIGHGLLIVQSATDCTSLIAEYCEPFWGGPGFENLLVFGETEVAFYGNGAVVLELANASSAGDSWFGGSLPSTGFWGAKSAELTFDVEAFVANRLR